MTTSTAVSIIKTVAKRDRNVIRTLRAGDPTGAAFLLSYRHDFPLAMAKQAIKELMR